MQTHNPSMLELLLVLCKICQKCDETNLRAYVGYGSRYLKDSDFTKIVYTAMKVLLNSKCGESPCEDWLISNLYKIYKTN